MEKEANVGELSEENKKIDELEGIVKERVDELQATEFCQPCILNKEQETDSELEAIKRLMIEELTDLTREESTIGIKQMRQLDEEVFLRACKSKGAKGDLELEAAHLSAKLAR